MFAVIKTGGKQYRVATDDILKVERLEGEEGGSIEFVEILMVGEGDNVTVGAPMVDGAMVTAEIVKQGRARKVIAFKKRRRQNSRRKIGHRQYETTVRIGEILVGGAKPSKKAAAKKDTKAAPAKKAAKSDADASAQISTAPKGDGDKLTELKGVGPVAAKQLNEQGITTFAQIAALTADEIAKMDENLPFSTEQFEEWQAQAKDLIKG